MEKMRKAHWIIIISLILFLPASSVQAKFIKTFLYRIGGDRLSSGDEVTMAKYDIIMANKNHYDDISGDSWGKIKAINPNVKIYLYTSILYVYSTHDNYDAIALNDLGRYGVSRGHSMGQLDIINDNLFLLNSQGERVTWPSTSYRYLLDFGSSDFRRYSIEATIKDHIGQPWTADGVFSDNLWALKFGTNSTPVLYDTDDKWTPAMNGLINEMTFALHAKNQKFACNFGLSRSAAGFDAWISLDNTKNPPDVVIEEAAFAVRYGDNNDVQFYPPTEWKRQVDILAAIRNSSTCFLSHTDIAQGGSGTDNYSKSVTFWDVLWFALGSYKIGQNSTDDNSYFGFTVGSYSNIPWFDEYDSIDLGNALGTYQVTNINGVNIYWRAFERGYVYVNPTTNNVSNISLSESCKELNHTNFKNDITTIPDKNTISLNSHRAAFLYKSSGGADSVPPFPPKNLRIN